MTDERRHDDDAAVPQEALDHIRKLADIHFDRGHYERALDVMRKLTQLDPENAEYWRDAGATAREVDRNYFALYCLQQSLKLDPDDRLTQLNIGEVLCEIGQAARGIEVLRLVFEERWNPEQPPEAHDDITIRAGAALGSIAMLAEEIEERERLGGT